MPFISRGRRVRRKLIFAGSREFAVIL